MDPQDALRRLRRALDRVQADPQARLRLVLDNDPPGVACVALSGISTNHGMLMLHLTVQPEAGPPARPR